MQGPACLVSTPSGLSLLYSPGLPPAASAGSLVRAPPFFRTSTGHRVEGRNPWHLQCSRNQLRAGTQFRRLVRSLSLRPSWLLASWADQTEPRLSLPQASTSGLPALRSPRGLPDMTTAPNGELRRQDLHLQVQQLVSLRSLPWVPGTAVPHLPDQERTAPGLRYYAPLRLPVAHLGGVRCSLSFPDALGRASGFVSLACARLVCEADASLPRRESSPRWSALLCLIFPKETIGSPKFPSHPCESMPRSSGRNTVRATVGREFPTCTFSVCAAGS